MSTTSPYKNIFTATKCLSFDEISAYNSGSLPGDEKHRVEEHLLECELCSSALAGFAAVPVTVQDINDLHEKINTMSERKAWYSRSYFIAGITIALFSAIFLLVSNPFKEEKKNLLPAPGAISAESSDETGQFETPPPPSIDEPTLKKVESIRVASKENFVKPKPSNDPQPPAAPKNNAPAVDPQPKTNKTEAKPAPAKEKEEETIEIKYNAPVRYMEDLKITDFEKLYTKPNDPRHTYSSVPAWQENEDKRNDLDPFAEEARSVPADEVLSKGLRSFKHGRWAEAITQFNLLLEHNSKDINALFYKGISAWNLNRSLIAQNCLMQVLASENNVFHQEAKWYLALTYVKAGETDTARELLTAIINEKGFYTKQAKEALKQLH